MYYIDFLSGILPISRSTRGIKRLTPKERENITLTPNLKDIIIGLLLGDGHISRRSDTGNSRLVYTQSLTVHLEYFNHVFSLFHPIFFVENYIIQRRKSRRGSKEFYAVSFTTMQLPCFNFFKEIFYKNNLKIVPLNIYHLLTPIGLAFWIMDDGSKQGSGLHLSVYAFSNEDVDRLMFTLQDKFNLKCSIHYNRDNKPRIYIFKESMDTLRSLVRPYFINEMLYKLGL